MVVTLEIDGTVISSLLTVASSLYGMPPTINPASLRGFLLARFRE